MGGPTLFSPDFTLADIFQITTSGSDAYITIPVISGGKMTDQSSWWFIIVAGDLAYINYNGAATSSCALLPITTSTLPSLPIRIAPGTVVHALQYASGGTVTFVRATVAQ